MSRWFESKKRGYLLDFQVPDSTDPVLDGKPDTLLEIDPERIVGQLKDAGVTALYTHARDYPGCCYYDTKVGHKHTGIGDRDLLAEFSEICRREDMTILFYVYIGHPHDPLGSQPPYGDFATVDENGNRRRNTTGATCMNGPGREHFRALLKEISEGYDFDGYWLDCFSWGSWERGICYCDICKARFRDETSLEYPAPDDRSSETWKKFVRWIRRDRDEVKRDFNGVIRAANPKLTIVYNAGPKTVRRGADGFDTFDDDDYLCSEFHYQDGHGLLSLQCLESTAVKPGVPFEIEIYRFFCRFNKMQRSNQIRPVVQHVTEMATVLAHGGIIQYYDQIMMDGTVDTRSMEMLKGAFAEVEGREPFLSGGEKNVPYAAIVWSSNSETFDPDRKTDEHRHGIEGFHFALMEEHIPYRVISDRAVRAGDFGDVKVVMLPTVSCLSEKEAEKIRAFVEAGGGLVATYRTSLCDENGNPRKNFLLADLFGADYSKRLEEAYSYYKFPAGHDLFKGLPENWPMSMFREYQLVVGVRDGAERHGTIVNPFLGHRLGAFPGEDTPHPALVTNKVGKGRVVYVPHPLGLCYGEFGHVDAKQLIVNTVTWAAGETPPIEVECPGTVEIIPRESGTGNGWVIHMINRTGSGPARTKNSVVNESIPVRDIVIRLPFAAKKATLQPEGFALDVTSTGGSSEIVVPKLDIYSILVVDK